MSRTPHPRTTVARTAVAGLLAGALLLTGCGSESEPAASSDEATTTAAAELRLDDVWARQSPSGATAGAVYLTITSPVDDQLTDVAVDPSVAEMAQIHETVMAEEPTETTMDDMSETTMAEDMGEDMGDDHDMGTMTMQEVEAVDLPAGEAVALEPGGYHIMLMGLAAPLEVGDEIEVTLTFAEAGERTVTAEVREG